MDTDISFTTKVFALVKGLEKFFEQGIPYIGSLFKKFNCFVFIY